VSETIIGIDSTASLVEANQESGEPGTYCEIAPPTRLRVHVECFWHRAATAARSDCWVLPDGCIDLIWAGDLPPVVAGPATLATMAEIGAGMETFGVRFRPGVAPHLLGVSARELLNQHVPLRAIWPSGRAAGWLDAMARPALDEKLDRVAELIEAGVAAGSQCDALVREVVIWMASHPSSSVDELARLCGISERQLRRRFELSVGYGPKMLQRTLRLQRLLWLARGAEHASANLARLAIATGYADQSHMTRETVALTGATPRQLLLGSRQASAMSDLFKTTIGHEATLMP
jgi:AraC-like DNA-binding protein